MPNPIKPTDYGIPANQYGQGVPLANKYLEDGSIPIFWGDNQKRDEDSLVYDRPSGMLQAPVHIPKVVRFLYTYDRDDDIEDEHKNDNDGSTPPVPKYVFTWKINYWGLRATLRPSYRSSNIYYQAYPYAIIESLYDAFQTFENHYGPVEPSWGDTVFTASYIYSGIRINGDYSPAPDGVPGRVEIREAYGSPIYQGPITGATTWFEFPVYRSIIWYLSVDGGPANFVAGFDSLSPPGTSGTQPPRCWYQPYSDGIHTPPMASEYPIALMEELLGDDAPCDSEPP